MPKTYKNMKGEEMLNKLAEEEQEKYNEEDEEEYEMPMSEAISEHKRLVKTS